MPEAEVSDRRRIPTIWIVPAVAAVLGIWMVVYSFMTEGPEIVIVFPTAEGIEAGKTRVRVRSVEVGTVEGISFAEDFQHVEITAKLGRDARPLLREDSSFWVVRPRIGAGGVTGLGTLVSGAYIELDPGTGEPGRRRFDGLEDIPVTPAGTPGLRLRLVGAQAGSIGSGDPVFYLGYTVGRVESLEFDPTAREMRYEVFIDAPHDVLVDSSTRFWNKSGVSFVASAEGFKLNIGSLQSLLVGGVEFGVPEGRPRGEPVENGTEFRLHDSYESAREKSYRHQLEYVVAFDQSVGGLLPGASVEYRGIQIGRVRSILLRELTEHDGREGGQAVPVLIELEPGRIEMGDSEAGTERLRKSIESAVAQGLRATLASGNLITGRLKVSIDMYPGEDKAELGTFAGYTTIPTISGGLAGLEHKVSTLLDKFNDLPLDQTMASVNGALRQLEGTIGELRTLVADEGMQRLPQTLESTVGELQQILASLAPDSPMHDRLSNTITQLNSTLEGVDSLTRTLDDQPNSLIFGTRDTPDPVPGRLLR